MCFFLKTLDKYIYIKLKEVIQTKFEVAQFSQHILYIHTHIHILYIQIL